MGCVKLHILDEQYKRTELKVSYFNKGLTLKNSAGNVYSVRVYAYCLNNPVRFTDPTGMEVEADELSQTNIRNTLRNREASRIKFDENGKLNTKSLKTSIFSSKNMKALNALAKSEITYSFQVSSQDHAENAFYDNSATGGNFFRGVTEMPGAESNPSPDSKVYVLVGDVLSEKQQTMTTAHEGFGHAYVYEKTRDIAKASHTYKSEGSMVWDEEFQMNVFETTKVPTNIPLEKRIKSVVKQAEKNDDKRKN